MKRRVVAVMLAAVMAVSLAACGGDSGKNGKDYTWDVTVQFPEWSDGEKAAITGDETVKFTNSKADGSLEFTAETTTAELKVSNPASSVVDSDSAWKLDDGGFGFTCQYEVVTALTEGDTETHGELTITLKKPDYFWDITASFENGAEGEYVLTNPGLEGWEDMYLNQRFTVNPDNPTFSMQIFDPSDWEVDNTQAWYQWVVNDVDDEGSTLSFEIVEPLEPCNYEKHGQVTVHIAKP